MPQSGLFGFPTDIVVLNQAIDSGAGRWQKPVGFVGRHTIIVRTWGGGAGGYNISVYGGGGGGFNQRAYDYAQFPQSVEYSVGAGGAAATAGGDTYVFGDGVDVAATGGQTAAGSYAGGKPGFRFGTSTIYTFDHPPYEGGLGGTGAVLNDAMAIWGGGAGLITVSAVRPQSVHGGTGSSFDGSTYYPATAPGGGGTFYDASGVGQNGRVQFIIVRGIVLDLMGNVF